MKKTLFLLMAGVLLLVLLLSACAQQTPTPTAKPTATTTAPATTKPAPTTTVPATTTKPATPSTGPGGQKYGGTLIVITPSTPLAFGVPALLGLDAGSIGAAIPAIQTLVNNDNSGKTTGTLAESWKIDVANKTITFSLRKGIKFHDGTDFNAQAAKWNMDQVLAKKISQTAQWNSVDIVDDYTVRVNLKTYQNTALTNFESSAGMMISPTAFQKNGEEWAKINPVGTGAFKLKNFQRDVSLEYEKNTDYWEKGKPYLNGLKFQFIKDAVTARMAFQAKQGDVVTNQTEDAIQELKKAGFKTESRIGAAMVLIPDSTHKDSPFANIKVRQAVALAIDRDTICDRIGFGTWDPMNQPAAKTHFGQINITGKTYDPLKARQLLAEAGYPNGFTTTITTSSTFTQNTVQALQAYLDEVKITVKLDVVTFAKWNEMVYAGWNNSLMYVTQGATDTNYCSFLDRYYSAAATRYPVLKKPDGLTAQITDMLNETEYDKYVALSQKAVKILVDDMTVIHIYVGNATNVLQTYVNDTSFNSLSGSGFRWYPENAWLNK